ncbi:hypothetical protein [Oribacterium sp. WCC10]|uniref:hypothetical protein n=1 Tax=Oribacterium sp. WCC10 TaxID=1855343 RepID=UPI0011140A6E|nr:hypothetical protein [Oribacterium sp. WCC10]
MAFLIPVFGLLMLIIKCISNRYEEREADDLEVGNPTEVLKMTDDAKAMDVSAKSIVMDEDDVKEKVVPITEALVVNDTETRRALIIDVLYSGPEDYVKQLFEAKANGDTELVHYAATALTEIQKEFDLKFRDIMARKIEEPDNKALDTEYRKLLELYIDSGLLKGEGLKNQLLKLSGLLEQELHRADKRGKWTLINKKAQTDLRLKDIEALKSDIRYMMTDWNDREETYVYRIQGAVLERDRKLIKEIFKEIRDKGIHLSSELKSLARFWDGETEGNGAFVR